MAQAVLDDSSGDTCGEERGSVGVSECVRCGGDIEVGGFSVVFDQFLDGADGEGAVSAVLEQGCGRCSGETTGAVEGYLLGDTGSGGGVEGDDATAGAFAEHGGEIELVSRLTGAIENEGDEETGDLTDPKTGVIEEEDQEIVALSEGRVQVDGGQQLADLTVRKMTTHKSAPPKDDASAGAS